MNSTILVTGATGKTGRRLLARLQERGQRVRAASRKAGQDSVVFDWHQPSTYAANLDGVAAVYLVPPEFVEDPSALVADFLRQAKAAGVQRVVALSSMGVEFPDEPQDSGRRKVEQAVMDSGMEWTLLRPTGFSQNFSEGFLLPAILQLGAVVTATGEGAVAFVDADDIAAVAAAALTEAGHASKKYLITGPRPLTFSEAAGTIAEASGRPIIHSAIPRAKMAQLLQQAGMPDDYAAMVLRDQDAVRAGLSSQVTDTVEKTTGRPAKTFEQYAASAARVWMAQ
jgi:uncharacterized protein YbjT (DUF2867 family)